MIKNRVASIFTLLALVFSLLLPVSAATAKNYTTGGYGNVSKVMVVKTKKATKLKFSQIKGKISYSNAAMGTSYLNTYGDFFIYVKDMSGKERSKMYNCYMKKSATINLSANKTYEIIVCPSAKDMTFSRLVDSGKLWYRGPWCNSFEWVKLPEWTITAEKVLSLKVEKITKAPQQ